MRSYLENLLGLSKAVLQRLACWQRKINERKKKYELNYNVHGRKKNFLILCIPLIGNCKSQRFTLHSEYLSMRRFHFTIIQGDLKVAVRLDYTNFFVEPFTAVC